MELRRNDSSRALQTGVGDRGGERTWLNAWLDRTGEGPGLERMLEGGGSWAACPVFFAPGMVWADGVAGVRFISPEIVGLATGAAVDGAISAHK